MNVGGVPYRTIWRTPHRSSVTVIDQTKLPRSFETRELEGSRDAAVAIQTMVVRGAPLIGVTAAFGMWLAMGEDPSDAGLQQARTLLEQTRPTAVNLRWALDVVCRELLPLAAGARRCAALALAERLADQDSAACQELGRHGAQMLRELYRSFGSPSVFHVLTHCNAGWLATVDWGTALSPLYQLHQEGLPLHVWVDETRPRNQGYLTAWELSQHGIANTLIADNAGGLLMQRGRVHACIVGSDRTTRRGDVCNKVGTYLKALAAREAGIPFYVALPVNTFDLQLRDGRDIPIEIRSPLELTDLPFGVENPAFDVTPAELVTALITERGVCEPNEVAILSLVGADH